jgi:hypothetical protein
MSLNKRLKNFLIFLTLISFSASVLAQDVSKVLKGNPAPYDGWCLTERAMAKIIADKEQEDDRCHLKVGKEVDKLSAKYNLKVGNLNVRVESLESELQSTIQNKNQEIEKLEKVALSRPNNYWYLFTAGGFVVGAGSVLGIWVLVGR